jgi:adenosine kinase
MSEPAPKKSKTSPKKKKVAKSTEKKSNFFIVGTGNPLLDISTTVPTTLLEKYGLNANDAILAAEKHLPIYDELVKNYEVQYIAGGATQNSIRVAQWVSQTAGSTAFLGSVGKDAFGAQLRKSAESDGLQVVYQEDDKTPTGTCACLITGTNRSLVTNLQAANNFKLDHLKKEAVQKVWQQGTVYYSAGFFLTVSVDSLLHLAAHAAEKNALFTMNLSAPFICQVPVFREALNKMLPHCDIIFGNEAEAKAYAEASGLEDSSPAGVAKYLAELPKENKKRERVAVITQGALETIVYSGGKISKYNVPKIAAKDIVDANGAGDAFVGGFLAYLAQGKSLEECVKAGQYAAWEILQVSGTVIPKHKPNFRCFE